MADFPTRLDLYAIGRDYVKQKAKKIDPAQIDVAGTDVNIFVGSASVIASQVVNQLAYAVSRLLLDGAEEDDLDRYAFDRYSLLRKGASAAKGSVRFYRSSFAAGSGSVPVGTRLKTLTGVEYTTTTVANFGATDLSSTAYVQAVQAGKPTQCGANAIRKFSSISALWDSSLQVNNDNPTAGGEPSEDDDTFRNRIRDFWRTARRGILAAIEFGAKTVPGVTSATAVESLGGDGNPARIVTLYIADSSGVASQALANLVKAALLEYRAAGIAVVISTSIPLIVDIELSLSFRAGVDTLTLSEAVRAAVMEFVNSLPVNGTLYLLQLGTVLQRYVSDGVIVNLGSVVVPTGDLVPSPGQTLRTTLANIKINFA